LFLHFSIASLLEPLPTDPSKCGSFTPKVDEIANSFNNIQYESNSTSAIEPPSIDLIPAYGFIQFYPSYSSVQCREQWILNDLFVCPSARRNQIAECLMSHAAQFAQSTGAGGMKLITAVTNTQGQALYEKMGWMKETQFFTYYQTFHKKI
jgi:ribosomal protein S18 acetylase RimI-like enzyme